MMERGEDANSSCQLTKGAFVHCSGDSCSYFVSLRGHGKDGHSFFPLVPIVYDTFFS